MNLRSRLLAGAAGALALTAPALAEHGQPEPQPATHDVIVVTGYRLHIDVHTEADISPEQAPVLGPDAAGLVARLPGAALIDNGAVSGQVQYRGLFGPRAPVTINGASVLSGGPNLMDPPLHYAPMPLVERIEVDRGVAPVSRGPGMGGGMNAILKSVDFTSGDVIEWSADTMAAVRSVDGSYAVGGVAGGADSQRRMELLFSREEGGDIAFPGGDVPNSHHERTVYGLGGGVRTGDHQFDLSYRRLETSSTGTAPLAMDIRHVETDMVRATYEGTFGEILLDAAIGWSEIDHGMDNFFQRPNSNPMMHRFTRAMADALTAGIDVSVPLFAGDLELGIDREEARHDARITNPNNAGFSVDTLPDIESDRTGIFAEWTGAIAGLESELGLRADHFEDSAGEAVAGPALPAGPHMLAMTYNMADRDHDETTVDAVARFWRETDGPTTWRLTLARKTRVANFVERFAWLPTPMSAGLADGNTYVGDLDLERETAWSVEAGFDWRSNGVYLRPTTYYRRVDDFIQGVPFDNTPGLIDTPTEMVSSMNGDPTPLRFGNVDAEFYGLDADFGWQFATDWHLSGVASIVRGKRRDIDDDLYRIAPARLLLDVTWEQSDYSLTFESQLVAEQTRVSLTNDEKETPGYAIFGARLDWYARDTVIVTLGVENLLDHTYVRHLAGYNRVASADVAVGERLPGAGRGLYARVSAAF